MVLSGLGVDVTALGIEQRIIEKARRKAAAAGQNPTFLLGDMRDVSSFNLKRCDLITCMGNSISHLLNTDDMLGTLAQFYTLLQPGGMVLIHTLNYDLILEERVKRELNMMLSELGFKKIKNYLCDSKKFGYDCCHNITVAYRPVGPGPPNHCR